MERAVWRLGMRGLVFLLASLSFACLLGQIHGLWSMRVFACLVLVPSTLLLAAIALRNRGDFRNLETPAGWIVLGAIAGLISAVAYDLYRLPFVMAGAPLFNVFPRFGELVLESHEPRWLVHLLGWSYHFSNGAALGIMFLAVVTAFRRANLFWCAIAWALVVEALLLISNYANFFGFQLNGRFLFLTISAHLVFGIVLGILCQRARLQGGDALQA